MKWTENLFQEFVDALNTARNDDEFERVATRTANGLGFRWFAYLRLADGLPRLISSYPKSWTSRYLGLRYQELDPVVRRAHAENAAFSWGTGGAIRPKSKAESRFFDEATTFGIKSGLTVPIRGGFGRMAAFTLATDDPQMQTERLLDGSRNALHLIGLYFHTHLAERLRNGSETIESAPDLSQRERQCLAWAARGKTIAETAVLVGVTPRTVAFHLENARRKLDAVSIAHCVAQAMRRGLLS